MGVGVGIGGLRLDPSGLKMSDPSSGWVASSRPCDQPLVSFSPHIAHPFCCSNFQGFGKELFTDAGKYVVHFGSSPTEAAEQVATAVQVGQHIG